MGYKEEEFPKFVSLTQKRDAINEFLVQADPNSSPARQKKQIGVTLNYERTQPSPTKCIRSPMRKKIQPAKMVDFAPECDIDPMKILLRNPSMQITDKEKNLIDEINGIKESTKKVLEAREKYQSDFKNWLQERKQMISQTTKEMMILSNPEMYIANTPSLIFPSLMAK